MKGKTIIFGAPGKDNLTAKIIDNLNFLGFNVIDISFDQNFKYKKVSDKVYNFLRKLFLKDTSHKKKLRFESEKAIILKKLSEIEKADYTLIIRPDIYPKEFLVQLKNKTKQMMGYQWDGMHRFPEIKRYTHLFNRFFVFDEDDVKQGFLPLSNFYFDSDNQIKDAIASAQKKIFFVGTFMKSRVEPFIKISKQIKDTEYENMMYLYTKKKKYIDKYSNKLNLITEFLPIEKCEEMSKEAFVLVDINNKIHNGLSFRTFEAIKYQKKLITNNPSIKKYDFYCEENILLLEKDSDYEKIKSFLNSDYKNLPKEIYDKYSFTNWIHYVLDIPPYIPISLPKN